MRRPFCFQGTAGWQREFELKQPDAPQDAADGCREGPPKPDVAMLS